MVGDSIMRYQYLSLVFKLRGFSLLEQSFNKHPLLEKSWPTWAEFYNGTTSALSPNEVCDCYRGEKFKPPETLENRFYFDREHNIRLTYFESFGDLPLHGRIWPADQSSRNWSQPVEAAFSTMGAVAALRPTAVVYNQGHWGPMSLTRAVKTKASLSALTSCFFFQSTTPRRDSTSSKTADLYPRLIFRRAHTIDTSEELLAKTSSARHPLLQTEDYTDDIHFLPRIYDILNRQFLRALSRSPSCSIIDSAGK